MLGSPNGAGAPFVGGLSQRVVGVEGGGVGGQCLKNTGGRW